MIAEYQAKPGVYNKATAEMAKCSVAQALCTVSLADFQEERARAKSAHEQLQAMQAHLRAAHSPAEGAHQYCRRYPADTAEGTPRGCPPVQPRPWRRTTYTSNFCEDIISIIPSSFKYSASQQPHPSGMCMLCYLAQPHAPQTGLNRGVSRRRTGLGANLPASVQCPDSSPGQSALLLCRSPPC